MINTKTWKKFERRGRVRDKASLGKKESKKIVNHNEFEGKKMEKYDKVNENLIYSI